MRYGWMVGLAAACVAAPAAATTFTVVPDGAAPPAAQAAVLAQGAPGPVTTFAQAEAALQDGDTVIFKPGTYQGGLQLSNKEDPALVGGGEVVFQGPGPTPRGAVASRAAVTASGWAGLDLRNVHNYTM